MARRSLWRRLRRATRDPRNAALARAIGGFGRALSLLPMPVALAVGRGLGTAAHALLAAPRRLAVAHMGLAFPELDLATRRRLVRETFRHAGQAFAELSLFEKILRRPDYIRLEGVEALDAALARGRGAIAVTGHVGNWELLAAWAAAIGYPITVVVRRVNDLRFHSLIVRFRAGARACASSRGASPRRSRRRSAAAPPSGSGGTSAGASSRPRRRRDLPRRAQSGRSREPHSPLLSRRRVLALPRARTGHHAKETGAHRVAHRGGR